MFFRLGGNLDQRDLKPYSYPPLAELRNLNYRSVCLGSYAKWDVPKQSEIIMKELDWIGDEVENVPPKYSYEKNIYLIHPFYFFIWLRYGKPWRRSYI